MTTAPVTTIGSELERQRLEYRIQRTELVLQALEDRATLRSSQGDVPAPLREAIRDFAGQLRSMQARRAQLAATS